MQIQKHPVRLAFYRGEELFLKDSLSFFRNGENIACRFKLDDNEAIYGGGARSLPIDHNGQSFFLFNLNRFGYKIGESVQNVNIPLFLSEKNYGLYFDNYSFAFCNPGNPEPGIFKYQVVRGTYTYFVFTGNSIQELLHTSTELLGSPSIPPEWLLGYLQTRAVNTTQEKLLATMSRFRDEGIPVDALLLDIFGLDSVKNSAATNGKPNSYHSLNYLLMT